MPQTTGISRECARFEERFMAYLEHDLDASERVWMHEHQAACVACGRMQRDVDQLVQSAAALPTITPTHDLWSGIASRLDTPIVMLSDRVTSGAPHATAPYRSRGLSVRVFAVAATMLVAVSSAITWQVALSRSSNTTIVATRLDSAIDASVVMPVVNADVTYEREIAALRTIVSERFGDLDSTTVAVLQRNLAIIDQAIADSRTALEKDPNSRILSASLDRALEAKLSLMRRVALL